MVKKILATFIVAATLMFSGCDSEGEDSLSMQQSLDKGNGSVVIDRLKNKLNKTDGEKMTLASAYMSRAGLSLTDTLILISDSSNSNDDSGDFIKFAKSVESIKGENSLLNLDKAVEYYNSISEVNLNRSSARGIDISEIGERDLYLGIAYLTKSTVVMSYLGDVSKLEEDAVENHPNLVASSCAIVAIYGGMANLPAECTTNGGGISIADADGTKDREVTVRLITSNMDKSYTRLAKYDLTDLYLTDYENTAYGAIKNGDAKPITIREALINTLSDAFDLMMKVAPDDSKEDIADFKREIIGDAKANLMGKEDLLNYKLTAEDISIFISNKN